MSPRLRPVACAVALPLVVGLSGCGVTDTEFRPGVAAQVDGDTISVARVDDLVDVSCDYAAENPDVAGGVVARGQRRALVLQVFVLEHAVEALAAENGVELTDDDAAPQDYPNASEEEQEALARIDDGINTINTGVSAIGAQLITDDGGQPDADPQAVVDRGADALTAWLDDHDVELNPAFGLSLVDGQIQAIDGYDLSIPVSDEAQASDALLAPDAAAGGPDDAVAALPENQRCG